MSIEAMKQAKQVIAMMGVPNPLNFSKEEIIAWQKCNADLDQAIAEAEKQEPVAWRLDVDEVAIYRDGERVLGIDYEGGNDSWRKALNAGAEIVRLLNAAHGIKGVA